MARRQSRNHMVRGPWSRAWLACIIALTAAPPLQAQVMIAGLSDLALGQWNGSSDLEGEVEHCVLGGPGGRFSIQATGDGPGNSFALLNSAATLPYLVAYNDGGGWSQLVSGTPLGGQRGSQNANQFRRCLDGSQPAQSVRVRVLAQELGAAIAGEYSGTLTLLVAPE
jgi:hypothetical protein